MLIDEDADDDVLIAPEATADSQAVALADEPVGPGMLAVDVDLAALARPLCLRARLEQAGDVEPHVDAHRAGGIVPGRHVR